jgi:ABC-type multidrug transport system permease subunit
MKKDYHYYHKKGAIYAVLAIIFIVTAIIPTLIHFNLSDASKNIVTPIQLLFGFGAATFYALSMINQNRRDNIRLSERQQRKKEAFNNIIQLVRDNKSKEAVDALYDYDNKYN